MDCKQKHPESYECFKLTIYIIQITTRTSHSNEKNKTELISYRYITHLFRIGANFLWKEQSDRIQEKYITCHLVNL